MTSSGRWLLVTPAYNESARLPRLAASLKEQTVQPLALWVIADDGSTDGTDQCIDPATFPFPVEFIRRTNTGGLSGASERVAFEDGVRHGLARVPDVDRILKIDADLVLAPDHFAHLAAAPPEAGLTGGVIIDPGVHSQPHHIRGGLRSYSRAAWEAIRDLPMALGWDVLDEVTIRERGMSVVLVPEAISTGLRRTGSSEGSLRGMARGGVGARWTGYHPVYFLIRAARHAAKRPYIVSGFAMVWGYVTAGRGPFPLEIKQANRRAQAERLRAFVRSPIRWSRENMRS